MNKTLFSTQKKIKPHDTVNKAGGLAYSLDSEKALCQYVVTCCFNNTYYSSTSELLDELKKIVSGVSSELLAKAAVYARKIGMKDTPAYLLAVLAARGESELFGKIFNKVITNAKMLCNFVQVVRSGVTGRKSFGSLPKKLIQNWLTKRTPEQLFYDDVGKGNPSLADIIKMVHPKAENNPTNNMFRYLLGKDFSKESLPELVKEFEDFKVNSSGEVPAVPFQCLSNIKLSETQWKTLALNMPWNTLRMNLNQINRHNVLKDKKVLKELCSKLSNKDLVKQYNVFPYQLLTTYNSTEALPLEVKNALNEAMEHAVSNVPSFDVDVSVCVDVSGSMSSAITGNRNGSSSVTKCVEVAALIASSVIRNNKNTNVVPFDTRVHNVSINPYDSVLTNTKKLSISGGGTDCSVAMEHLIKSNIKSDLVIFVSDNMSWADYYRNTNLADLWLKYKNKNKKTKLVLIDLTPNAHVQVNPQKDVLNIGGWSDEVYAVISNFVRSGDTNEFVNTVKAVEI